MRGSENITPSPQDGINFVATISFFILPMRSIFTKQMMSLANAMAELKHLQCEMSSHPSSIQCAESCEMTVVLVMSTRMRARRTFSAIALAASSMLI
jgi:hypothetical protein